MQLIDFKRDLRISLCYSSKGCLHEPHEVHQGFDKLNIMSNITVTGGLPVCCEREIQPALDSHTYAHAMADACYDHYFGMLTAKEVPISKLNLKAWPMRILPISHAPDSGGQTCLGACSEAKGAERDHRADKTLEWLTSSS